MQTPNEETKIRDPETRNPEPQDAEIQDTGTQDSGAQAAQAEGTGTQDGQNRTQDAQSRNQNPYPPRRRRRKKKTIPLPTFLTHLGEDVRWYYDIRLWSPLLLLILILALVLPQRKSADAKLEAAETTAETAAAVTTEAVTEAPTEEALNEEAVALARLADSVGAGYSDNVKTIIMWVAINRSEDQANGYGKTLLEEIARPDQWQGYNENAVYSESTYQIALEVLDTQASGGLRPLDSDMLWLVLNDNGSVTVRNKFSVSGKETWREKTVK